MAPLRTCQCCVIDCTRTLWRLRDFNRTVDVMTTRALRRHGFMDCRNGTAARSQLARYWVLLAFFFLFFSRDRGMTFNQFQSASHSHLFQGRSRELSSGSHNASLGTMRRVNRRKPPFKPSENNKVIGVFWLKRNRYGSAYAVLVSRWGFS